MAEKESRQGGVTRSEMTRRTVHTARTSLGKLEKNSSERILESSSLGEIGLAGNKTQSDYACEKHIQRTREKAMLAEYNQKFSNLLTEKEKLIRKLRAEKKALQEGKIFLKESITSRYEEVIQERESLVKEKMEQIGELHNDLSRAEARLRELENSLSYQKSILESKDKELSKMKDLNIENNKLRRDKAENERKIKALEEKLFKETTKNKNMDDRRYKIHLEEIDKIVEKYCKNIDGSGSGDISKKLSQLQDSFISKHNYEAEMRRRERETVQLKEKYEKEEKTVAELSAESGKLKCQIDSLRSELSACKLKLSDAETRLSDEECVQRGEIARLTKIIEQLERRLRDMEKSSQAQWDDSVELRTEIDIYGTLLGSLQDKGLLVSSSSSSSSSSEAENGDVKADCQSTSHSMATSTTSTSSTLRRIQKVVSQQQTFKE